MHLFSVFSLRNRALIALVTIVVAVFGGISLTLLKQELIPSISLPQLVIVSSYPGASPAVVEHDVSTPIENAIQAIPGLQETTATSSSDASNITAQFDYNTDLAQAEEKITTAINRIKSTLPDGVDPQVIQFSLSDFPIVQLGVTSDLSAVDLSDRLQRIAIPTLSKLDGVASVGLQGDRVQEIDITPDSKKLTKYNTSTQAIQSALQQNGALLPAGSVTTEGQTLNVQAGVRLASPDDVAALPLVGAHKTVKPKVDPRTGAITMPKVDDTVYTIGDVASVALADQAPTGYARVNGKDALTLSITKTDAGNTVSVSDEVLAQLDALASDVGGNTTFTVVFNQAPFITQSIESLTQEGLLGLVFAVIVILIFLLSIRSTLVTAVSIPTSVLITFIGMWASGYTLNIITLGGLTIAIGRVVDDSIVVIENIKRHIEFGEDKKDAILRAVREVAGAVTASTITTIAVFLPIGLVGEEVGELFRPFAVTVAIALVASLLVALTIVPVLAYWFLGKPKRRRALSADASEAPAAAQHVEAAARALHTGSIGTVEERPSLLQRGYLPIIRWTLKYPVVVILLAILVLGGTGAFAALGGLKINFIGDSGQNTATVTESFDPGTSLDAQDADSKRVESALLTVAGVQTVQTTVGSSGGLQAAFGSSNSASFSLTTDPDGDQAAIQAAITTALAGIHDAGTLALSASQGFSSSTVDITVRAPDDDTLQQAATIVENAVKGLPSVAKTEDDIAASLPYVAIEVDRAKAAKQGLSEAQVGSLVMAAMNPSSIGTVNLEDRTVDVYIKDDAAPSTLDEIKAFKIPTATGDDVKLGSIATVERALSPASITTDQGIRMATVSVTPATDDTGATTFAVNDALQTLSLPSGASVETGGAAKQLTDTFSQLGLALLAAILIVYVVMVATFKSLRQPLLLLVSIPFAGTGAVLLQVASGIPLGASSLIGVLMLVGIVVTNAIVLVDLVNKYRVAGMDARTAVEQGAARRLRPILMTAAATIFALIPLATGLTGHGGGFISQPLAIIVIGGLISSTVLTLIVLPSLYYLVEGRAERRAPKVAARRAAKAERKAAQASARAESERIVAERQAEAEAARAARQQAAQDAAAAKLAEQRAAPSPSTAAQAELSGPAAVLAAGTVTSTPEGPVPDAVAPEVESTAEPTVPVPPKPTALLEVAPSVEASVAPTNPWPIVPPVTAPAAESAPSIPPLGTPIVDPVASGTPSLPDFGADQSAFRSTFVAPLEPAVPSAAPVGSIPSVEDGPAQSAPSAPIPPEPGPSVEAMLLSTMPPPAPVAPLPSEPLPPEREPAAAPEAPSVPADDPEPPTNPVVVVVRPEGDAAAPAGPSFGAGPHGLLGSDAPSQPPSGPEGSAPGPGSESDGA